jgi:hypothetical protein
LRVNESMISQAAVGKSWNVVTDLEELAEELGR